MEQQAIIQPPEVSVRSAVSIKAKHDYFDLLKAIAIYFVVFYHFNSVSTNFLEERNALAYLHYFFLSALSICVPTFFFVNGALLLNKQELDVGRHAVKIVKIAVLVITWGVITMVALLFIRDEPMKVRSIIKSVWQLRQGWVNHLWYLEALVVIYVFFPLIFIAFRNSIKYFYFFLACVMVFTFGNTFLSNCAAIISIYAGRFDPTYVAQNYFSEFNAFKGIYGFAIGYFMLGGILFCHREALNTQTFRRLAMVAAPVSLLLLFLYGVKLSLAQQEVWDIVWYGYDTVFTLTCVIALFILSLNYKHAGLLGKLIKITGENSLGIYFLHIIIGFFLQPVYAATAYSTTILGNALFAFVILLSSAVVSLALKRLPVARTLLLV